MDEREYIKGIVVKTFNENSVNKISESMLCLGSIEPRQGYSYGYLIGTNVDDSELKIKLFINISNEVQYADMKLETVENVQGVDNLADEVYVILASITDTTFKKFSWLESDCMIARGVIMTEDNHPIITEDNHYMVIENNVSIV